jgi:hypothetical protein
VYICADVVRALGQTHKGSLQTAQPVVRKATTVGDRMNEHSVLGFCVNNRERKVSYQSPPRAAGRRLAMRREGSRALRRGFNL